MIKPTGIILGIHRNSEPNHFVVLGFIRGNEYPTIHPETAVASHAKLTHHEGGPAYRAVWFQETTIPLTEKDGKE